MATRRAATITFLLITIAYWGVGEQALAKDEVSTSTAETEMQCAKNEEKMIECIQKGIYDPCDYGGGPRSWIYAQCAWGHAEVAERKIKKLEGEILRRLRDSQSERALEEFKEAQRKWRESTDYYCRFTNDADEAGVFEASSEYLSYGFCLRRLREQRVKELVPYVTP